MKISSTAEAVLNERYLLKNSTGKIVEDAEGMFRRAAKATASADRKYRQDPKSSEKDFFLAMKNLDFLPNSPTLMNAGTKRQQLSACFVLPVEDSISSIFTALRDMAVIHQTGGGVGFSFSKLRPEGAKISTSGGISSGPVSFIRAYNTSAEVMKSGGKRRGANMAVMDASHPDILKFIHSKDYGGLSNFNISVGIHDKFMKSTLKKGSSESGILDEISISAWKSGDPGVLFPDEINRKHPLNEKIDAVNPCGEMPLLPYESCNLGSINLSNMVTDGKIDFEKLGNTTDTAVHFLDNVIDITSFPMPEIMKKTLQSRKIGLGVMGFAEMLIKLGIRYDSEDAVITAGKIMKFITSRARQKSEDIAGKRGSFPDFRKSRISSKYRKMRNATVTSIAPTGTISIIAGTSSGIEPLFALEYTRNVLGGKNFREKNPLLLSGKHDRKLFVTSMEIKPEQHVKVQAAFQKYTDNAVSKTVNMPSVATSEDIRNVFILAWNLKCKGITVYRDRSKDAQVLNRCESC